MIVGARVGVLSGIPLEALGQGYSNHSLPQNRVRVDGQKSDRLVGGSSHSRFHPSQVPSVDLVHLIQPLFFWASTFRKM